jgi:Na+/melibiose symporter-like transporter
MVKEKKENPDKVGAVKFLAWQTRGVSAAANFIVASYVTIYCTDTLQMSPALVGTLLFIIKIADGVTDLFAGYIVDRTNSRLGKGRPCELAILGAWLCTWLLFSTPVDASLTAKCIWIVQCIPSFRGSLLPCWALVKTPIWLGHSKPTDNW